MAWKVRTTRREVLIAAALFIIISAFVLWSIAGRRQRVDFSDGLSLEWLDVTQGTNALMDGSVIEQLLGDSIPAQGIDLGNLKLLRARPLRSNEEDASLTAWIRLEGPAVQGQKFGFYWESSRVVATNSSGRQIELPPATNETVIHISLYAFPRDEKTVRLRISPPREDRAERRWAEFEFKNPFYGKVSGLIGSTLPITNVVGEHEFVLKEVRTNPTQLVFLMPTEHCYEAESYIADEEGNRAAWMGKRTRADGRRQTVELAYGLEPNRTRKISATFVATS